MLIAEMCRGTAADGFKRRMTPVDGKMKRVTDNGVEIESQIRMAAFILRGLHDGNNAEITAENHSRGSCGIHDVAAEFRVESYHCGPFRHVLQKASDDLHVTAARSLFQNRQRKFIGELPDPGPDQTAEGRLIDSGTENAAQISEKSGFDL